MLEVPAPHPPSSCANCETRTPNLHDCSVFLRQDTLCHAILLWLLFLLLSCRQSSAKNRFEPTKYLFRRCNCPDLIHSNGADQPALFSGRCSFHTNAFGRWLCFHVAVRSQSWLRGGHKIDKMPANGTRPSLLFSKDGRSSHSCNNCWFIIFCCSKFNTHAIWIGKHF